MTLEERIEELERITGAITEVHNTKMDLDAHNIQNPSAVVIETQMPTADNGYTWYRKYSDGWVEQGGRSIKTDSGTELITITLPIEMSDTNYFYSSSTGYLGNDADQYGQSRYSWDTISFQIYITGSSYGVQKNIIVWQVSGMAAE